MSRKRFTAEQIVIKLREAEVVQAQGKTVVQVCKQLGVTEQTDYRWRKAYGGLRMDQAKRLKSLEQENARLKKLVAGLPRAGTGQVHPAKSQADSQGGGATGDPDGGVGQSVRSNRVPEDHGDASLGGLEGEPQARGKTLAAGGAEGPVPTAETQETVAP